MTLKLVTPPAGEIVTVEQAKLFLRMSTTNPDNDTLIEELITAARQFIEGPTGKLNALFLQQTWDLVLDRFPVGEIMIPLAPVQSITSVSYYDEDGVLQVVDANDYYLDPVSRPPWLLTVEDASWPDTLAAANAVTVRFVGGFPAGTESESGGNNPIADNVPFQVKLAVKLLVQDWHDNRKIIGEGQFDELPFRVRELLQPYRMFLGESAPSE